jgi:hypothetical protein
MSEARAGGVAGKLANMFVSILAVALIRFFCGLGGSTGALR